VSKVTTDFWLGLALLVAWMVGLGAAEYAGSITGSTWVAASAGALVGIALGYALGFRREEEGASWVDKTVTVVAGLAFASYGTYQIVTAGPNELGFMDYEIPVAGGWLIGISIFLIWSYAKTRKSDVTQ
jgi:hypothetical protein